MFQSLKIAFKKSESLSQAQLHKLISSATKVYEQDRYGVKVAQLSDGSILKIFRVKRFWSGAQVYSYARRFCRNVTRLHERHIPVPQVINIYHIPATNLSAVRYIPLSGKTIKELMKSGQIDTKLAYKVGQFIAQIHALGIYFRGLHVGNIVLTPSGELGLIDVSELSIYWRLSRYRRLRNFARFWRSKEDRHAFGNTNADAMVHGYLATGYTGLTDNLIQKRLRS